MQGMQAHCPRWSMVREMQHRHERFFRELARAQIRMPSAKERSTTPGGNAHRFPGATALIFQSEHVHRTHDIPCNEFRPDTLYHYLIGDALLPCAPQPLVPLGIGPISILAQRGGATTCALFHVRQRCGGQQQQDAACPSQISTLPRYDAFIDVFCANGATPERSLWHHDTMPPSSGYDNLLLGSDAGRVHSCSSAACMSLFAPGDTVVTTRVHDNAAATVVRRFWELTSQTLQLTADAATVQVSPPLDLALAARQHDLPLLALSLPTCRSSRSIAARAPQLLDAWGVPEARLAAPELEVLKRLHVHHPVTAVLAGLLLFRLQVQLCIEGSSRPLSLGLLQYSVGDATQWALPAAWPCVPVASDAGPPIPCAPMVVSHVGPTTASAPPSAAFRRTRAAIDARRLFDRMRCIKTPHDAAMFYRSAIATAQCFVGGMRAVTATRQSAQGKRHVGGQSSIPGGFTPLKEHDILRAMQSAAWAAEVVHPSLTVAVPTHVFGYPPVVAAGRNALAVHYTQCGAEVPEAAWVLVDAGVELNAIYPTDCTRCWPAGAAAVRQFIAGGEATVGASEHTAVYNAVLVAQRALLQQLRAGLLRATMHAESRRQLGDAVVSLRRLAAVGCGQQEALSAISPEVVDAVTLHAVGHYLGFDIHEKGPPPADTEDGPPAVHEPRFLGGTMHTVEPGLYFRTHDDPMLPALLLAHNVPEEAVYTTAIPRLLGGIGMRIEDSVLVLPGGTSERSLTGHTRAEYLNALVATHGDHLAVLADIGGTLGDASRSAPPTLKELRAHFVQQQAQSIWGSGSTTAASLAASAVCDAVEDDASWYPFDIVVLTACVPKDLGVIRDVMRRERVPMMRA